MWSTNPGTCLARGKATARWHSATYYAPCTIAAQKSGFHAFRRFRTQVLRRARVPEDLIGFWLGHARRTVTDLYAIGLQDDLPWRREWAEKVGVGFGLLWATNFAEIATAEAA
jgi:integrase